MENKFYVYYEPGNIDYGTFGRFCSCGSYEEAAEKMANEYGEDWSSRFVLEESGTDLSCDIDVFDIGDPVRVKEIEL